MKWLFHCNIELSLEQSKLWLTVMVMINSHYLKQYSIAFIVVDTWDFNYAPDTERLESPKAANLY